MGLNWVVSLGFLQVVVLAVPMELRLVDKMVVDLERSLAVARVPLWDLMLAA